MDAGGWAPLLEDEDQRTLLAPLSIISMSSDAIEDDGQHAKAVTQSIDILPDMVSVINDYWNPRQRSPLRAKSVLAHRRPSNPGITLDKTDVAMAAHDPTRKVGLAHFGLGRIEPATESGRSPSRSG